MKPPSAEPAAKEELRERVTGGRATLASLAHEINQPLAATSAYLSVARRLLAKAGGDGEEIAQILEKAAAQTQRASRLVSTLRDFLPREETDKAPVSLHEEIRAALDWLRAEDAPGIGTTLEPAARRDSIIANRLQIRLALCHLVRDAAAAIGSAGRGGLVIRTSNPDTATIKVEIVDADIAPADLSGAFDCKPLTAIAAKGIGPALLSSVLTIEEHDGLIWADSSLGKGPRFRFTLPVQDVDAVS